VAVAATATAAEPVPHGSGETCALVYCWLSEEEVSSARGSSTSPFQQRTPRNLRAPGVISNKNRTNINWHRCKEMCFLNLFMSFLFISQYPSNQTRCYQNTNTVTLFGSYRAFLRLYTIIQREKYTLEILGLTYNQNSDVS